jgi:hypothetical protein
MNAEAPEWNSNEPAASLGRFAGWLNAQARATFLKDGTHAELFFLYRTDGQGALVQPPSETERDQFVAALRAGIKEHDIYGVIHVSEAWTYLPKQPRDHTFTQVAYGEIKVSELTPADRTEALVIHLESRDGAANLWLHPIVRTETGVTLADPVEWSGPPRGRFAQLFDRPGAE